MQQAEKGWKRWSGDGDGGAEPLGGYSDDY